VFFEQLNQLKSSCVGGSCVFGKKIVTILEGALVELYSRRGVLVKLYSKPDQIRKTNLKAKHSLSIMYKIIFKPQKKSKNYLRISDIILLFFVEHWFS